MIGMPLEPRAAVRFPVARQLAPGTRKGWWLFIVALLLVAWSLTQAGLFNRELVNGGGWALVGQFLGASLRPDLSAEVLGLAIPSMLATMAFAVCGTAFCVVIGVVGGVLSSRIWWQSSLPERRGASGMERGRHALPWLVVRGGLAVPRAIHEIIWGLFFINILGLDPLVAILAIGVPYGAITAKVYADILDETPQAPMRALLNGGASPLKAFMYGLFPQAFPDLLSYGFYRLECAIRSAAVLGLIGAGGLGYQVLLSLQSLRYEQVWAFLYLLILLSGLTDAWSSLLRRRLQTVPRVSPIGEWRASALQNRPSIWNSMFSFRDGEAHKERAYKGDLFVRYSLVTLALLVPFSFLYVGADFSRLFSQRTMQLFAGVVGDSFPPNLDPKLLLNLVQLSVQTLGMSIIAMLIAGVGGLLLSFPAAANFTLAGGMSSGRMGVGARVRGIAALLLSRGVLLVTRAFSEGIWALLALFVLFPGVLPGAIGLGLYNLGVLGRLMAEVTENVDPRPRATLRGQGASGAQAFLYGVLPQTLTKNLAYILYRWEVCVRATVVVGLVGAGGLGRLLGEQLSSFDYRSVLTSLIFYTALTFLVDLVSAAARRLVR